MATKHLWFDEVA